MTAEDRIAELEADIRSWASRNQVLLDEKKRDAERVSSLSEALKAANALISEFNSYSTGCSCLAEEDVAQLFGEYTEALERCEARQETNGLAGRTPAEEEASGAPQGDGKLKPVSGHGEGITQGCGPLSSQEQRRRTLPDASPTIQESEPLCCACRPEFCSGMKQNCQYCSKHTVQVTCNCNRRELVPDYHGASCVRCGRQFEKESAQESKDAGALSQACPSSGPDSRGTGDNLPSAGPVSAKPIVHGPVDTYMDRTNVCMRLWDAGFTGKPSAEHGPIMDAAKKLVREAFIAGRMSAAAPGDEDAGKRFDRWFSRRYGIEFRTARERNMGFDWCDLIEAFHADRKTAVQETAGTERDAELRESGHNLRPEGQ